jgi:long-chain acyl-CoA synthetase
VKLGPDGEVLVRGAMISGGSWSGGAYEPRRDEWLATGDLAESVAGGELRFVGRKSEVIVTAAGVNIHPEDLEAAVEQEPDVAACAVVAMVTASGPEPCAVLAMHGSGDKAGAAIEHANRKLAEFQHIRRWVLWPEPDLPRTSTGKVRRKAVAAWLVEIQAAAAAPEAAGAKAFGASTDWLLALIAAITGETPVGVGDELRLSEDLQLDSLGRVQLAAALEERLGIEPQGGLLERAETLGELRALVAGEAEGAAGKAGTSDEVGEKRSSGAKAHFDSIGLIRGLKPPSPSEPSAPAADLVETEPGRFIYPRWPWLRPFWWLRVAFIEAVEWPLVWLLAHPRVVAPELPASDQPMLIVANHVTAYDGALVQCALPVSMRRRIAVAMAGEMLEDYRHFRNPDRAPGKRGFYLPGPLIYLLITALFNVFPLPRRRNFQRSFAHAGAALDRGYNVLVFPEGTRSAEGKLARFRGGIGLLARQSGAMVLPVAIRGLGELKAAGRGWFRSGKIEVHVGQPMRFAPEETETAITERLHAEVERLLKAGNRE